MGTATSAEGVVAATHTNAPTCPSAESTMAHQNTRERSDGGDSWALDGSDSAERPAFPVDERGARAGKGRACPFVTIT
jgi:hypothetical protein